MRFFFSAKKVVLNEHAQHQIHTLKKQLDTQKEELRAHLLKRTQFDEILRKKPSHIKNNQSNLDDDDAYLAHRLHNLGITVEVPAKITWSHGLSPYQKVYISQSREVVATLTGTGELKSTAPHLTRDESTLVDGAKTTLSDWSEFQKRANTFLFTGSTWKKLGFTLALSIAGAATVYFFIAGGGFIPFVIMVGALSFAFGPILIKKMVDVLEWITGKHLHERLDHLHTDKIESELNQFLEKSEAGIGTLTIDDLDHLSDTLFSWQHTFKRIETILKSERAYSFPFGRSKLHKRYAKIQSNLGIYNQRIQELIDKTVTKFTANTKDLVSQKNQNYIWQIKDHGHIVKKDITIKKLIRFIELHDKSDEKDKKIDKIRRETHGIYRFLDLLHQVSNAPDKPNELTEDNPKKISQNFGTHLPNFDMIQCHIHHAIRDYAENNAEKSALEMLGLIMTGQMAACADKGVPLDRLNQIVSVLQKYTPQGTNLLADIQAYLLQTLDLTSANGAVNFFTLPFDDQKSISQEVPHAKTLLDILQLWHTGGSIQKSAWIKLVRKAFAITRITDPALYLKLQTALESAGKYLMHGYSGKPLTQADAECFSLFPVHAQKALLASVLPKRLKHAFKHGSRLSRHDILTLHTHRLFADLPPISTLIEDSTANSKQALLTYRETSQSLYNLGFIPPAEASKLVAHTALQRIAHTVHSQKLVPFVARSKNVSLTPEEKYARDLFYGFIFSAYAASQCPFQNTAAHEIASDLYLKLQQNHLVSDLLHQVLTEQGIFLGHLRLHTNVAREVLKSTQIKMDIPSLAVFLLSPQTYQAAVQRIVLEATISDDKQDLITLFNTSLAITFPDDFAGAMNDKLAALKIDTSYIVSLFQYLDQNVHLGKNGIDAVARFIDIFTKNPEFHDLLNEILGQCPQIRSTVLGTNMTEHSRRTLAAMDPNSEFGFRKLLSHSLNYGNIFASNPTVKNGLPLPTVPKKQLIFTDKRPIEAYDTFEKESRGEYSDWCKRITILHNTMNMSRGLPLSIYPRFSMANALYAHNITRYMIPYAHEVSDKKSSQFWDACATPDKMKIYVDCMHSMCQKQLLKVHAKLSKIQIQGATNSYLTQVVTQYFTVVAIAEKAIAAAQSISFNDEYGNEYLAALSLLARANRLLYLSLNMLDPLEDAVSLSQNVPAYISDSFHMKDFSWIRFFPQNGSEKNAPLSIAWMENRDSSPTARKIYWSGLPNTFFYTPLLNIECPFGSLDSLFISLIKDVTLGLGKVYSINHFQQCSNGNTGKKQLVTSQLLLIQSALDKQLPMQQKIELALTAIQGCVNVRAHFTNAKNPLPIQKLQQAMQFLFYLRQAVVKKPDLTLIELATLATMSGLQHWDLQLENRKNTLDKYLLMQIALVGGYQNWTLQDKTKLFPHEKVLCMLNALLAFLSTLQGKMEEELWETYIQELKGVYEIFKGVDRIMAPMSAMRTEKESAVIQSEKDNFERLIQKELKDQFKENNFDALMLPTGSAVVTMTTTRTIEAIEEGFFTRTFGFMSLTS